MDSTTKKRKKPLKRSKLGFEIEIHILDKQGRIKNKAPEIIEAVKKRYPDTPIIKECAKNFFELTSYPAVQTYSPALHLIESLERCNEVMETMDLMMYPFGMYPHKFNIDFSDGGHYSLKEKIFGSDRFRLAPFSAGFHSHYSLPKGVFDYKKKNLKIMNKSKLSRSLVNSYNFCIASDPAITLFSQSSPFFDGKQIAKDCKNLVYRGGKKLDFEKGVYTKLQMFANLPPYKTTVTDIMDLVNKRWKRWDMLSKKADSKVNINKIYETPLELGWNPVKINRVGTIEHRSPNTNFLSLSIAHSILFKFSHRALHREFIELIPADFAINEPFKLENNILYIPPHSHLRNKIQKYSIYDGFKNKDIRNFSKRFFNFAKSKTPKKYHNAIKPIYEMIDEGSSMSDKIISYTKRKGYLVDGKLSKEGAQELSIHFGNKFVKDIEKTKKMLQKISSV